VLGPILFLIYINELCEKQIDGRILTYADDTVLIYKDKNWPLVYNKANNSFQNVYGWLNSNMLTLNKSKTVHLAFSVDSKTRPDPGLKLKIHSSWCQLQQDCNCDIISRQDNTKYLGIEIDNHLKWNTHITATVKKARNLVYIFYRLRNILPRNMLLTVYQSLVQSIIQYGIIGWGGANNTNLLPLTIIQKTLLKIIIKKKTCFSTDMTFKISNVLDIKQLFIKTILIYFFKNADNYKQNYNFNNRTRGQFENTFVVPRKNKLVGQLCTDYYGPKIYNKIPIHIRNNTNLYIFKKEINAWMKTSGRGFCEKLLRI
jgi:hypothetical protein